MQGNDLFYKKKWKYQVKKMMRNGRNSKKKSEKGQKRAGWGSSSGMDGSFFEGCDIAMREPRKKARQQAISKFNKQEHWTDLNSFLSGPFARSSIDNGHGSWIGLGDGFEWRKEVAWIPKNMNTMKKN